MALCLRSDFTDLKTTINSLFLFCFLFFLAPFSFANELSTSEKIKSFSQSKIWLRLLHYKRALPFFQLKSELIGPDFFFSSEGQSNPEAELIATLNAFTQKPSAEKSKRHPQCAFPERYRVLKKAFELKTVDIECAELEFFLKKFNAKSATLVFSTAYQSNPGSMFGHTFLRINTEGKQASQQKHDLLDYGVSYSASVSEDENPLLLTLFGLFGGYQGHFLIAPYYAKVKEYIQNESRDLWEYDLDLTQEETLSILRHVWEIETNTFISYYFLNKNCSYELLALLEVAKPDWNLTPYSLYVVPAETVKTLTEIPHAIQKIRYRPSLRKKMLSSFSLLTAEQKSTYFEFIEEKKIPTQTHDALLLDAWIDYLYFEKKRLENQGSALEKVTQQLKAVLMTRSQIKQESNPIQSILDDPKSFSRGLSQPDLGHFPAQLSTSLGYKQRKIKGNFDSEFFFQEFKLKAAYHDLLNNDLGYTPFSQIDFPSISVHSIYSSEKVSLQLNEIQFFSVTSFYPITFIEKNLSWAFNLSYKVPEDLSCAYCHVLHFDMGAGLSIQAGTPKILLYSLGLANIEVGSPFEKSYRFGPKIRAGALFNPIESNAFNTMLTHG